MIASVSGSVLKGCVKIPGSKSMTQRALALALLTKGKTTIHQPGRSKDDLAALQIVNAAGADYAVTDHTFVINSTGIPCPQPIIHTGESGLSFRMFAPVLAISELPFTLTGTGTLMKRTMEDFENIARELGLRYRSQNGYLPVWMQGPLQARSFQLDGSKSSQYLTGLLFALGAITREEIQIRVSNLVSKPYIDLSMQMMRNFGLQVEHMNYETFFVGKRVGIPQEIEVSVESDWSGAAFFIVAAALCGDMELQGLNPDSLQSDKKILEVLDQCGITYRFSNRALFIGKTENIHSFQLDATDCPDLFPPLAALALFCNGTSMIKGVHRLTNKESNRAIALTEELGKLGGKLEIADDYLIIEGGQVLHPANVDAHHDHRMAMALSVIALKMNGTTIIEGASSVEKSFPDFFELITNAGAQINLKN